VLAGVTTPFTCVALVAEAVPTWQSVQALLAWLLKPCWPVLGRPVVAAPARWRSLRPAAAVLRAHRRCGENGRRRAAGGPRD
jgi:hypothetical protein